MMATLHQFIKKFELSHGESISQAESNALLASFVVVAILILLALIPARNIPVKTGPVDLGEAVAREVG